MYRYNECQALCLAFDLTFGSVTVHPQHHLGSYLSPCRSKDKQKERDKQYPAPNIE